MTSGWYRRPLAALDLETTGVDPHEDRVVTAAVWDLHPATGHRTHWGWLVDPGVEIPQEATDVHGVTTGRARAEGQEAAGAVVEIAERALALVAAGRSLVVFNAAYDITMLAAELDRYGHHQAAENIRQVRPVVDPMVIDRRADRYRKGSRKLVDMAHHYGVALSSEDAHGAAADALAAARVAYRIGATVEWVGRLSADRLHDLQAEWSVEQSQGLAEYWRRTGDPRAGEVEHGWPARPPRELAVVEPEQGQLF